MLNRGDVVEASRITSDIQEHLLTLYDLVLEINAKVVVELGAGRSTYVFIAAVNATEGQFYSIDVVPGRLALEPRHHPMVGDDLEIVKTWDQSIDLLFIDTLHTYEQTKGELDTWSEFVMAGGIIAMHDTTGLPGPHPGCRIALDEFLGRHAEYSAVHYPNCNGLSVLRK